jgi:hypothetical protein
MLRSTVESQLREDHGSDGLVSPSYEDNSFANVPDTIQSVLDAGGRRPLPEDAFEGVDTAVDRVVLVLVDGYGHVDTVPEENIDLSANDIVVENLRQYDDGTPVKLSGSPRNVHLHLQEGTVEETREALSHLDAHSHSPGGPRPGAVR